MNEVYSEAKSKVAPEKLKKCDFPDYNLLAEALDGAHVGVWKWDIITNEVFWSDNVNLLFGLPPGSFKGSLEHYLQLLHPDDLDQLSDCIRQAFSTGKEYSLQHRIILPDDSIRWLEGQGKVTFDDKSRPLFMTGIVRDITDTKRAEVTIKDRETLFGYVAETTRELFLTTDWSEAISKAFKKIGNITGVDRMYLFKLDPVEEGKQATISQLIEWNKGTAEPQINNPELQKLLLSEFQSFFDPLLKGDILNEIVSELEEGSLKQLLTSQEIQSILIFPISTHTKFWGFLGFDQCTHERRWEEIEIAILKSFSTSLSGSIEKHDAEVERSESESRYKRLQEASFGGICIHDNGVIIDCNQGLCDITGYSREELIGMQGVKKLIAPEYRDMVERKINDRSLQPYDVQGIRKDGTRVDLEIQGKNVPYLGKMVRVAEFRDITERKKAEQKIQEEKTKLIAIAQNLTRKNEQLEEFTRIVSHNLRSPAGNISTLLTLLRKATDPKEHQELMELLQYTSDSLLLTMQELNEVLKIKQNETMLRQELKFMDVFERVQKIFHAEIMETNALVTCDFSDVPSIEYANIYLESIFLNLLGNALKYRSNKRTPHIHFTSSYEDGSVILRISDNGLGINLEKYGHQVFKMRKTFHRHPDSRGIGLFMIKNQVESMGGEISVDSKENEGTTFIITFNKSTI